MRKIILVATMLLLGCHSVPFKVNQLEQQDPTRIESTAQDLKSVIHKSMGARYKSKKSPTFALINGFYRLPKTQPFGAVTVVRNYSYQTHFEAAEKSSSMQDYAIVPFSVDDALAFTDVLNALLNIGVKIKDITMSDALAIAKAEGEAFKTKDIFRPQKVLQSEVDYLISIYPSTGSLGPVLVGRVIKKDGSLMAFRVVNRLVNGSNAIDGLITSLFEDTISRI